MVIFNFKDHDLEVSIVLLQESEIVKESREDPSTIEDSIKFHIKIGENRFIKLDKWM